MSNARAMRRERPHLRNDLRKWAIFSEGVQTRMGQMCPRRGRIASVAGLNKAVAQAAQRLYLERAPRYLSNRRTQRVGTDGCQAILGQTRPTARRLGSATSTEQACHAGALNAYSCFPASVESVGGAARLGRSCPSTAHPRTTKQRRTGKPDGCATSLLVSEPVGAATFARNALARDSGRTSDTTTPVRVSGGARSPEHNRHGLHD